MQKSYDQKHWEKIGKDYSKFWQSKAKYEINKKELQFINSYLEKTKGQYILDIGVGNGRIIENYLKVSQVKQINGLDWAKSMVEYCRVKFKNQKKVREIKKCDISQYHLPFNKKFDFISAIRVLKYNKNWPEIIGKIIHNLNNDGIFVFTMPNKNAFLRFTSPETSIYYTTKSDLERITKKQNGEILQITSFMKLPDAFYDISDNNLYVRIILGHEKLLRLLLGDIFLGRIFFVAVKKRSN